MSSLWLPNKFYDGWGRPGLIDSGPGLELWADAVVACEVDFVRFWLYNFLRKLRPYKVEQHVWIPPHKHHQFPIYKKPAEFAPAWFAEIKKIGTIFAQHGIKGIVSINDGCNVRQAAFSDEEGKEHEIWWTQFGWGRYYSETNLKHVIDFIDEALPLLDSTGFKYMVETDNEHFIPGPPNDVLNDERYLNTKQLVEELERGNPQKGRKPIPTTDMVYSGNFETFDTVMKLMPGGYFAVHGQNCPANFNEAVAQVKAKGFPLDRLILSGDGRGGRGIDSPLDQYNPPSVADYVWMGEEQFNQGIFINEYWDHMKDWNDASPYKAPLIAKQKKVKELINASAKTVTVCSDTGLLPNASCSRANSIVTKWTEPKTYCTKEHSVNVTVCKVSGLLPTGYCLEKVTVVYPYNSRPTTNCPKNRKHPTCADKYLNHKPVQILKYLGCKLGLNK